MLPSPFVHRAAVRPYGRSIPLGRCARLPVPLWNLFRTVVDMKKANKGPRHKGSEMVGIQPTRRVCNPKGVAEPDVRPDGMMQGAVAAAHKKVGG